MSTTTTTFQAGDLVTIPPGGDAPSVYSDSPYASLEGEERVFVHTGYRVDSGSQRSLLLVGTPVANSYRKVSAGWDIEGNPGMIPSWIVDVFGTWGGWYIRDRDLALATDEQVQAADPVLVAKAALIARRQATEDALSTAKAVVSEGEEALAQYKREVAAAVTREATARGWCGEIDTWLGKLGLERTTVTRKVQVNIPSFEVEVELFEGQELGDAEAREKVLAKLGIREAHSSATKVTIGEVELSFDDPGCTWGVQVLDDDEE